MTSTLEREILSEPLQERLRTGAWKRNNIRLIERALTPGRKVVEIGAGLGYVTQVLARVVFPGGVVVSFEPNPVLFQIAEHRAMNCRRTIVLPVAVGVHPGKARIEGPSDEPWRCMIIPDEMGTLPMHSLDQDVLTTSNHFDAMVMDAEGIEHELLGAVDVYARGIRDIICEVHGPDSDVNALADRMFADGWEMEARSARDSWDNVCVWWHRA